MYYSEPYWPKATDLTSALERLRKEFDARAFECDHDAIYREWGDEEAAANLKEKALKLEKASEVITEYLEGERKVRFMKLYRNLEKMGFKKEIKLIYKRYYAKNK